MQHPSARLCLLRSRIAAGDGRGSTAVGLASIGSNSHTYQGFGAVRLVVVQMGGIHALGIAGTANQGSQEMTTPIGEKNLTRVDG